MKSALLFLILVFNAPSVSAFCFNEAGLKYNISPRLLAAIAYTESRFDALAINASNANKSVDYGLMQINTFWIPHLKKLNITSEDLLNDPCLNVHVGAWVLAQNFKQNGDNWESVGAYNAGFKPQAKEAREIYIKYVKYNYKKLH
ncbi:TPA: lytic transglycosylase domain-containing protein [Photobacterium damselae]